jgi:hypothetical protein
MLRRSDVKQKSDIIIAASSFSTSKGLMKDHEGLMVAPTQPEFHSVVNCPFLHIISGNNIGPRWQFEMDLSLKSSTYSILVAHDDCALTVSGWPLNSQPCILS